MVISYALAATAISMPWPALFAAVWSSTHSNVLLGVTGALRMLPYLALSAVSGMLADRVRRSTVVRWSTALRVALLAGSAMALHMQELVLAVGLALLTVAAGTPSYPAAAAAMPSLAPERRSQLTRLLVTAEVSGFVVGPALSGLLVGVGGAEWAIPASVAITLLALLLLVRVRTGPIPRAVVPPDHGRLRTVLRCPGVPLVMAVVVVVHLVLSAASIGLPALSEAS
jgi:MFS family permease